MKHTAILAVALMACAPFAQAQRNSATAADAGRPVSQSTAGQQVYRSLNRAQLKAIMLAEGYSVRDEEDGDLRWMIDGDRTFMKFESDGLSIMFYAGYADVGTTMKAVNAWNENAKYSRSYIDDEGDPILELDLDVTGGVTRDRIVDYLKTARMAFTSWRSETVHGDESGGD